MKKIKISLLLSCFIFVFACSHFDTIEKSGRVSESNRKSHNSGEDCMGCHNKDMTEAFIKAWWNIAGTVYRNSGGLNNTARIELWTEPKAKGLKILSLNTDKDANFYTEKIINFKGGCYPVAISENDTSFMNSTFNGGGCNGCHDNKTTRKIWVSQ
ncbi:MAG: hypothetical protein NTU43_08935 [Bacteroidetes bacterium]|nr:hypothetical protein [Bacteroidota bacterium]